MITKVSEIKVTDVADYIIRTEVLEKEDEKIFSTMLNVAKNFITNNTGVIDLDKYSDFVIVVFILCQDMYDNRTLYVDGKNLNTVVSAILDQHSINLVA